MGRAFVRHRRQLYLLINGDDLDVNELSEYGFPDETVDAILQPHSVVPANPGNVTTDYVNIGGLFYLLLDLKKFDKDAKKALYEKLGFPREVPYIVIRND